MNCEKISVGFCVTNGERIITVHHINNGQIYYASQIIDDENSINLYRAKYKKFKKMLYMALQKPNVSCFTKIDFKPYSALDLIILQVEKNEKN